MTAIVSVICALLSISQPFAVEKEKGMRDAIAFEYQEVTVIAVVLDPIYGMSQRKELLSDYAHKKAREFEKNTIVTQDLSIYMTMCRMQKRGVTKEAADKLLAKIAAIKNDCFIG